MKRRDLKIPKYMSEIAGDAFVIREGTTHPYSSHHSFAPRKCQITKSQAFDTILWSHWPGTFLGAVRTS